MIQLPHDPGEAFAVSCWLHVGHIDVLVARCVLQTQYVTAAQQPQYGSVAPQVCVRVRKTH
jgi:hypothetical protein